MDNKRITISQDDRRCYRLRDTDQTVELFGDDYLQEYGLDVPEDLLIEYKRIMKQYNDLQNVLSELYESQYDKG